MYQAVRGVSRELAKGPIEHSVRALVELRVSQLNGCGFCLAMHADGARAAGVPQFKLDSLAGWREDSTFEPRERAALALAEAMSQLAPHGVPDDVWLEASQAFTEEEVADLVFLVGLMNLYNRINVACRFPADWWREHGLGGSRADERAANGP